MQINKIILNNYRIYFGENELDLTGDSIKNVSIVAGNNGFGKTSLLTSMVWCLYGKLMGDVDDRYRREIHESGGYKRYCEKTINRLAKSGMKEDKNQLSLDFATADPRQQYVIRKKIDDLNSFSVSLVISHLFIPSIPCKELRITRTFNVEEQKETVEILIDGQVNELTKEVGHEIFINDFILPREIAKFFFFDAEKIVSLAEANTVEDKRNLSRAYAEVLGIKKYVDLKSNLENVQIRLRKNAASPGDLKKLEKYRSQEAQNEKLRLHHQEQLQELEENLAQKKQASKRLQDKLIREGSAYSPQELEDMKAMQNHLQEEGKRLKTQLNNLIDLAPFAIAGKLLNKVKVQLDAEQQSKTHVSDDFIADRLKMIQSELTKRKEELDLKRGSEKTILATIENVLRLEGTKEHKPLLDFTSEQKNRIDAIYHNLGDAYSKQFRELVNDQKKQAATHGMVQRKLAEAGGRESDPVIKAIRADQVQLDAEVDQLEQKLIEVKAMLVSLRNEDNSIKKEISELTKHVKAGGEIEQQKDAVAARLIQELDEFILRLKAKKKSSLEGAIKKELNRLMHKANFVARVEVTIEGDLIDIELYDHRDEVIHKDGLSMGERQLYATALLKALVDESNIRFPVFIDSPLQKFDRLHAANVIRDFYPNISEQVVLFTLLEKELAESEYELLGNRLNKTYLIENIDQDRSRFRLLPSQDLFKAGHQNTSHVYQH